MSNPYTILGVETNAPLDKCKKAYRRLAAKYHPDSGGDTEMFQKVNKAWEDIQRGNFVEEQPIVRKPKSHVTHTSMFTYRKV